MCVCMSVCVHVSVCMCMSVCVHVSVCMCMHRYVYMCHHTHSHTHVQFLSVKEFVLSLSHTHTQFAGHHEQSMPLYTIPSVRFGAGFLARTFSRFVKDLVDIAAAVCDSKSDDVRTV